METKLKCVINAREYIAYSQFSPYLKYCLTTLLKIIEVYTQTPLVVEIEEESLLKSGIPLKFINLLNRLHELGIIKTIHIDDAPYADEPFQYSVSAQPYGFGHDFSSLDRSFKKAIGESIERYLWEESDEYYARIQRFASYAQLGPKKALDIFSLAGFTEEQRKKNQELQFTKDTVFSWIPMRSLTQKKIIYCPTSLVSIKYAQESQEPMLLWNITTGQGSHDNVPEALTKALLEIIERDAFMISYLNKLTPPKINLREAMDADHEIASIITTCERHSISVHLLSLPTDFPVEVILAVLVDQTGKGSAIAVGASCDFNGINAIKHALSEALSVRLFLRDKFMQTIDIKRIHREERLIYWGKQENVEKLDFFLKETHIQKKTTSNNNLTVAQKLEILTQAFREKEYEICYVETSTRDLRAMGFRSVSVVAPALQPMHLSERIPYLGGARLREVPTALGYTPADILNEVPHPFP